MLQKNSQQLQLQEEAPSKFQNAAAKHKESAQRHLSSATGYGYVSSSDEDETEDSNNITVLDKLKSSFGRDSGECIWHLMREYWYGVLNASGPAFGRHFN